jgi:hypothetical protein
VVSDGEGSVEGDGSWIGKRNIGLYLKRTVRSYLVGREEDVPERKVQNINIPRPIGNDQITRLNHDLSLCMPTSAFPKNVSSHMDSCEDGETYTRLSWAVSVVIQ